MVLTAMSTATTVPYLSRKVTKTERRAYLISFRRRGWSQNEAARRIGKDPGLFSRWLRGDLASSVIRQLIDRELATGPTEAA